MNDEIPEALTDEEQAAIATEVGIDAIRRIHAIEREMLARAIQALVAVSGRGAVDIVSVLAEGLDEGYVEAMKAAYASAEIIKPGLIVPE